MPPKCIVLPLKCKSFHLRLLSPKSNVLSSVGVRLPFDNIPVTTGVLSESIAIVNLSSPGEYSLAKP